MPGGAPSESERRAFERPSADGKTCDDKLQELAEKVAKYEKKLAKAEKAAGKRGVPVDDDADVVRLRSKVKKHAKKVAKATKAK